MTNQTSKRIPNGWEETTLGEVAEIIMGQSPKGSSYNQDQDGLPFYQGITEFGEKYVGIRNYTNEPTKIVEKNTVLFSVRAPVGKVNFTRHKACIGRGNAGLRMKNNLQEFLYYLLKQNEKAFLNNSTGTVFDSISGNELRTFKITVPKNETEQNDIASVLSSFDDKVELLREQNKTLEATAQAIFKEWFVNFDYPDATGKMIDSELGEIPEGWRVGKLGEVIDLFDSKRVPLASDIRAMKKGKYPYYGATSIMDYIDDYLFDGTYLLLAEDGSVMDNKGHPVLQYVWGQFWVSNHAHVIQGKNGFSTEIVYVFLKEANITSIVNGAVQLKINQENLRNFEILIPSNDLLDKFDSILESIFMKYKNNISQIQTLSILRDTLLPKLMKGEIRVTGF